MIDKEIKNKIKNSKKNVFFNSDFKEYNPSTIIKILNKLIKENKLKRVSKGIYVKTKINRITGNIMFQHSNGKDGVYIEILDRLNIKYKLDKLSEDYLSNKTTQIPANIQIIILDQNFKRKIELE